MGPQGSAPRRIQVATFLFVGGFVLGNRRVEYIQCSRAGHGAVLPINFECYAFRGGSGSGAKIRFGGAWRGEGRGWWMVEEGVEEWGFGWGPAGAGVKSHIRIWKNGIKQRDAYRSRFGPAGCFSCPACDAEEPAAAGGNKNDLGGVEGISNSNETGQQTFRLLFILRQSYGTAAVVTDYDSDRARCSAVASPLH